MIITKEYLIKHATTPGGYTRVQLDALGLRWGSMNKGWMRALIGTELSAENAARFESKQTAKEARGVAKPSYADLEITNRRLHKRVIELEREADTRHAIHLSQLTPTP